jgi:signal transduction histidine kinase
MQLVKSKKNNAPKRSQRKKSRKLDAAIQEDVSPRPADQLGVLPSSDSAVLPPLYKEMLEAFARLQEQVHRRTVALASAAHELKTPLSIITGYNELLLSGRPGPLNETQRQALHDSQVNCNRLQRFIQEFLTYAALETGKLTMKVELGDLRACLTEVYEIWVPLFHEKGIALYLLCPDDLEPVPFDYYKIQQVVSNLLENALKFTPSGGTVWVSGEMYFWERRGGQGGRSTNGYRPAASGEQNSVRVTVADTGQGIPPEYLQEIFDDFVQVPQDKEGRPRGAGLGLAIARRLIHAHGGKVWAESEAGGGSKFSFLLRLSGT